jgi:hypothetical protein
MTKAPAANSISYGFLAIMRPITMRRGRTGRWRTAALRRGLWNRPRWAMWSSVRRSADSITDTGAGSRPDLVGLRGSLTVDV